MRRFYLFVSVFPDLFNNRKFHGSILRMKSIGLIVFLLLTVFRTTFTQTVHSSRDNYTGDWETPASWNPLWDVPLTSVSGSNITINGYISCNGPLTFSSVGDTLLVNDTLVINGDLRMGNSTTLLVNVNGILIVRGDFTAVNIAKIQIENNAFIAVRDKFIKIGTITNGSFVSNNSPSNVFIGDSVIPAVLDPVLYPVFSCPGSSPYDSSACSYGNMADLSNSPIKSFFEQTCNPTTANAGTDQTGSGMCGLTTTILAGNIPTEGTGLWSIQSGEGGTIDTVTSPTSTFSGIAGTTYVLRWTISDYPCTSTDEVTITFNALPVPVISVTDNSGLVNNDGIICEGESATLTATGGTIYSWSTGETTAGITKDTAGIYTVTVTDVNGCQNTADTAIIVNTLPVPGISVSDNSGIANNDGIICEGATAILTATGGTSYNWSTGETTAGITKDTAGIYTVTVTGANGCINTANKSIEVTKTDINAGMEDEICGQDYTLNAVSNPGTGTWTVTSGTGNVTFAPDDKDPGASVKITNYGSYQFTWTVINSNCPSSSDVTITFHEIPSANAGIDQELNNAFTTQMGAELLPAETGEWSLLTGSGIINDINSPVTVVSDLSPGENIFLWNVRSGNCSASDSIIVRVENLFVPQVITPNGDFKNDFFVIKDIEKNSPAELVIFNRWGDEVYHNTNYMNDWDGKSNNGTQLSNDTYFYILKFADGKITRGFVVIKR